MKYLDLRGWRAQVFILILGAISAFYLVYDFSLGPVKGKDFGWDMRLSCAAADADQRSLNPYYVKNLVGTHLSFTYQPALLTPIRAICTFDYRQHNYFDIFVLTTFCILLLTWCFSDSFNFINVGSAFVLTMGGFGGFAWVLRTGNVVIFEGLLISAFLAFVAARKIGHCPQWLLDFIGCVFFGIALSIKLILIPVAATVLLLHRPWFHRIKMFATILVSYLSILFVSIFLYPVYTQTYFDSLAGKIPGQHSAATENPSPSIYFLLDGSLHDLHAHLLPHYEVIHMVVYGLVALFIVATAFVKLREAGGVKRFRLSNLFSISDNEAFTRYSMVFLIFSMMMVVPRLKEYAFLTLALLSIPLVAPLQPRWRFLSLLFAVMPLIVNQPRAEFHAFPSGYIQFWSAFGVWAVVLFHLPEVHRAFCADRRF